MTRFALICLALTACNGANASKLDTPPTKRNLVCERVAILNPKAECKPELSGEGDVVAHTARVSMQDDKGNKATDVCALNAASVSMVCGPLLFQPKQEQAQEETRPDANPTKATRPAPRSPEAPDKGGRDASAGRPVTGAKK